MSWARERLLAFDLETTGTDPEKARIVQCALAHLGGGAPPETHEVLVDPGVEIPEEAVAIHGITTETARAEGVPAYDAVTAGAYAIGAAIATGIPVVGHNIAYDLTVLDRECRRHLNRPLSEVIGRSVAPVIDTLVLSKQVDPYRRRVSETQGAHQLKTCVEQLLPEKWGIGWDDRAAHGALYDCLMSARVAVAIAQAHRAIGDANLMELHEQQVGWRAQQCASFQAWLRSDRAGEKHDPEAIVRGEWPLLPAEPETREEAAL